MLKTSREQRLFRIFGMSLVGFVLWQIAGTYLLQPITTLQQSLRSANAEDQRLQKDLEIAVRAAAETAELQTRSLPGDPDTASVVYQHWLLRRLADCDMSDAVVTPGPSVPVDQAGHRIPFSISANATLPQIGALLDSIHTASLLHRITHLNIAAYGNSSSKLRTLTLTLEAFAVTGSKTGERLPAPPPVEPHSSLQLAFSEQDLFLRKLHRPKPHGTRRATLPATVPSSSTEPETWLFVGSVQNDGIRQAWFINSITGKELILVANDFMRLGSRVITLIEVHPDRARILDGNEPRVLAIGEALRETQSVTTPRSS